MKRALKNTVLWLLVLILAVYLIFQINPARKNQVMQLISGVQATPAPADDSSQRRSGLLQEKQLIEEQMSLLQEEIETVSAAPSVTLIFFSTPEEEVVTQAGEMMDACSALGILGVTDETLQNWLADGVPEYIRQRLEKNWEFCLILQSASAETMQNRLDALQLPRATAAYRLGSLSMQEAETLSEQGISIIFDDGVRIHNGDDGLWHVPTIGNMNNSARSIYESKRNTGNAVAFIMGNLRGDQQYNQMNLQGLLEMIDKDQAAGQMQYLNLKDARDFCTAHQQVVQQHQADWQSRKAELEAQHSDVLSQIGSLGQ